MEDAQNMSAESSFFNIFKAMTPRTAINYRLATRENESPVRQQLSR